ncbi:MAG: hypothetical protein J6X10_07210, partial [Bacteroidales bacterium]|nr:hypothetical protein [Bacteroidales bacterium]
MPAPPPAKAKVRLPPSNRDNNTKSREATARLPLCFLFAGGETGIRTLGPASWSTVFETAPID